VIILQNNKPEKDNAMIPRALPLWAAAAAVGLLPLHAAQAASSVKFPDKVCDITHYGAEGHRLQIALNTDAIQKAIDDCAAAGGERCGCRKAIS
jgi:hypothetical protein